MSLARGWWWLVISTSVVGLSLWILVDRGKDHPRPPEVISIAVLPFESPPSDTESAQLATGLSLDLLRRLQVVGRLQLSPRGQVSNWLQTEKNRYGLARELGAEILVVGRVRQQGGRVHLDLEIVDARQETTEWRLELVDSTERIFDLQRKAALEVVAALRLPVRGSEKASLRKDPTRSLKAWNYFVRGQGYLDDLTNPRGPSFAADLFRRAIQHDPDFLSGHAGLGEALWLGHLSSGDPAALVEAELEARWVLFREADMEGAAVLLTKVLQTASRSATTPFRRIPEITRLTKPDEALRDVATGLLQVGRLELAEAAWRAAVDLGEDLWLNSYCLGQFLLRGGRYGEAANALAEAAAKSAPEMTWPREGLIGLKLATSDLEGALEVFETLEQPLTDVGTSRQIAAAYTILGRLEPAEAQYRHALALDPLNASAYRELADVLRLIERHEEAAELYRRGLQIAADELRRFPSDSAIQLRFSVLAARARDCARAQPMAATLRRHLEPSAEAYHTLALVFALCGESEMAIDTLRLALSHGLEPGRIRSESEFRKLPVEPELRAILEQAGGVPPDP